MDPVTGAIALVGGNEFRADCEPMDRALLARLGRNPRIAILPTAAAHENPRRAADHGVRYFRTFGARADGVMITDAGAANRADMAAQIKEVDMVYFTGGDPVHLLESLRDSPAWDAVLLVAARGGIVAGSSAGAMALGGSVWAPGRGWLAGLGLAPQVAVVPHHATLAARWNTDHMRAALPAGITLVGIDVATALTGAGSQWQVLGLGEVTIYNADPPAVFAGGEAVALV